MKMTKREVYTVALVLAVTFWILAFVGLYGMFVSAWTYCEIDAFWLTAVSAVLAMPCQFVAEFLESEID